MKEFIGTLPKSEVVVDVEDLTEDMEIEIAQVPDTPGKNDAEAQNLSVDDFSIASSTNSNRSLEVDPQDVSDPDAIVAEASVASVPETPLPPMEVETANGYTEVAVPDSTTIDDLEVKENDVCKIAKTQLLSSKADGKKLGPRKVFNSPKEILHVDFAELIVEREV